MTSKRKFELALIAIVSYLIGHFMGLFFKTCWSDEITTETYVDNPAVSEILEDELVVGDGDYFGSIVSICGDSESSEPLILYAVPSQIYSDLPGVTTYDQIYPVVKVVDGDTVKILIDDATKTVRLVGVDTPETVHPRKHVEYYGREASRFTKNLLRGEAVWLVKDASAVEADRYGRLLGHLYRYPDGLWVNKELIRQGYGRAYTKYPFEHREEFVEMESRAKEANKGLWEK